MVELTPEDISYRAQAMRVFLAHDAAREVFETVENRAFRSWRQAESPEEGSYWWHVLRALDEVRAACRAIADREHLTPTEE